MTLWKPIRAVGWLIIGVVMLAASIAIYVIGFGALAVVAYAIGAVFRAGIVAWLIIWLLTPLAAWKLRSEEAARTFTLRGLINARGTIMMVSVLISFLVFCHEDRFRDRFGKHFVQGYRHWYSSEPEQDDDGRDYYPDGWVATTSAGSLAVYTAACGVYIGVFAIPTLTWRLATRAIEDSEQREAIKGVAPE